MSILSKPFHGFGRWYINRICKSEYEQETVGKLNERPIEYSFLFKHLSRTAPQVVLDIGTGTTALPKLISMCGFKTMAIDNITDYWPNGMFNRHFWVVDDDITNTKITEKYDFISCISVLEHIADYENAVSNIFSLLNPGGHAVFTFPYNEKNYLPNAYACEESSYPNNLPYVCHVYSREQLNNWSINFSAHILEQEYWECWDGEYWSHGAQIIPSNKVSVEDRHQLTCILIRKD